MRVIDSTHERLIGAEAWDRFVGQDPAGHLLQTWAWGELKGMFGWTPVRLAVEQDGTLVAGAQVLYRRIGPFSLGYIPKGPVLVEQGPAMLDLLWRAIHARSRRMRAILLKVEPEWRDEDATRHGQLTALGFRPSAETIQPRRTVLIDLCGDEESILMRMKPKWRYNIRLSERKGVEVRQGGAEDLPAFYELMRITGERDAFAIHSLAYYRQAWELFAPGGRAALFMAHAEGQPLGGLMAYAFNGQSWYMYGASANESRQLMPNHQLQWRAMQWARSKGCRQYDLWGIPDTDAASPTATLEGVERFKSGFGGEVVRYVGAYDYIYSPLLYGLLRRAWARRRAIAGG